MNDKQRRIILISIITILIFIVEKLIRDNLFEYSLNWIEKIQSNSKSVDNLFIFISKFGTVDAFLPIIIITFLWTPITKSFPFILIFVVCSFVNNNLKIFYSNPRPYWIKPSILKNCSSGYGNPSGHALDSTGVYLSLWRLITDNNFFLENYLIKYFLLYILIVLIFLITLSRVYLAVHSINQVIFGFSLGIVMYYIMFNIIEVNKITPISLFEHFRNKSKVLKTLISLNFVLIIFFINYILADVDNKYDYIIQAFCPKLNINNVYKNESLYKGCLFISFIGEYLGLYYFINKIDIIYPNKEKEIDNWYCTCFKNNIYRIILSTLFASFGLFYFIVSDKNNLVIIILFKVSIPIFLTTFLIYGPGLFIIIKNKFANKEIYNDTGIEKVLFKI